MKMKRYRTIALSAFIAVIVIGLSLIAYTSNSQTDKIVPLDNWSVNYEINHHLKSNMGSVDEVNVSLATDERAVLTTILPDQESLPQTDFPQLLFKTDYCAYQVYVDDKLLSSKYLDQYENSDFIGCSYHFLSLPKDCAGKRLTIRLYATAGNMRSFPTQPLVGDGHSMRLFFAIQHIFPIAIGIFLIVFGVIFFTLCLMFLVGIPELKSLLISSLFCSVLGVWMHCYYNVSFLLIDEKYTTIMNFICMFIMVPLGYIVLSNVHKPYNKRAFYFVAVMCTVVSTGFVCLHFAKIRYLHLDIPYVIVMSGLSATLVIVYIFMDIRDKHKDVINLAAMIGFSILVSSVFFEVVLYVFHRLGARVPAVILNSMVPVGGLIFAAALIDDFLVYITEASARKIEYDSLTHLAYADGLTDLPNRAKSDSEIKKLDQDHSNYCIISMDLNGLKEMNDIYGHASGDKYIKDFSQILKNTLGEDSFYARIGGDEFIAILKNTSEEAVKALISRMNAALEVLNVLYPQYHRSVSCGYAFHDEYPDQSAHDVYMLADSRMYNNKRIYHEKAGATARI